MTLTTEAASLTALLFSARDDPPILQLDDEVVADDRHASIFGQRNAFVVCLPEAEATRQDSRGRPHPDNHGIQPA